MFVCHVGGPLCIRRKILVERHMGMGVCANVASVYGALCACWSPSSGHVVDSSALDFGSF